jgi:hypothetical protein
MTKGDYKKLMQQLSSHRAKTYNVKLSTNFDLPPNARLFCLKKHPETHAHRNTRMIHSLHIFCERYDKF